MELVSSNFKFGYLTVKDPVYCHNNFGSCELFAIYPIKKQRMGFSVLPRCIFEVNSRLAKLVLILLSLYEIIHY